MDSSCAYSPHRTIIKIRRKNAAKSHKNRINHKNLTPAVKSKAHVRKFTPSQTHGRHPPRRSDDPHTKSTSASGAYRRTGAGIFGFSGFAYSVFCHYARPLTNFHCIAPCLISRLSYSQSLVSVAFTHSAARHTSYPPAPTGGFPDKLSILNSDGSPLCPDNLTFKTAQTFRTVYTF